MLALMAIHAVTPTPTRTRRVARSLGFTGAEEGGVRSCSSIYDMKGSAGPAVAGAMVLPPSVYRDLSRSSRLGRAGLANAWVAVSRRCTRRPSRRPTTDVGEPLVWSILLVSECSRHDENRRPAP